MTVRVAATVRPSRPLLHSLHQKSIMFGLDSPAACMYGPMSGRGEFSVQGVLQAALQQAAWVQWSSAPS